MDRVPKALFFDVFGTLVDWRTSIARESELILKPLGHALDWLAFADAWRGEYQPAMEDIRSGRLPFCRLDVLHRRNLERILPRFGVSGLTEDTLRNLNLAWHRLDAWPDFPAALAALRESRPVVSFTMLPTSLVVDVSRRNGITWDAIISCEMIGTYKPHPEAYVTAARWLGLQPAQILMVACHNFDLNAAHKVGLRTAFVRRPAEWGPEGPPDPKPNMSYDIVVDDFGALVDAVRSQLRA